VEDVAESNVLARELRVLDIISVKEIVIIMESWDTKRCRSVIIH